MFDTRDLAPGFRTHSGWFRKAGLPTIGQAFDRIQRGRIIIDNRGKGVTIQTYGKTPTDVEAKLLRGRPDLKNYDIRKHQIEAGGPGSGRHPGSGDPYNVKWIMHPKLGVTSGKLTSWGSDTHADIANKKWGPKVAYSPKSDDWHKGFAFVDPEKKTVEVGAYGKYMGGIDRAVGVHPAVVDHLQKQYGLNGYSFGDINENELAAGGPGSGCKGDSCGRPATRTANPKQMQFIHQYLDMTSPHSVKDAFIKANGKEYTTISAKSPTKGKLKECFMNAYQLATGHSGYTYVEGYATTEKVGIPLDHAWVVDKEGRVVDPTWKDGNAYFGVPIKADYLLKTAVKTRVYGVLSHTNMDLLRGKDKIEDIKAGGPGSGCHGDNCGRPTSAIPGAVNKILPQYENKDPHSLLVFRVQKAGSTGLVGKNAADLAGVVQFLMSDYYENHGGGDAIGVYRVANPGGQLGTYEGLQNGRTFRIVNDPSPEAVANRKAGQGWKNKGDEYMHVPPSPGIGTEKQPITWGIDQRQSTIYSFGPGNYTTTKLAEVPLAGLNSTDELQIMLQLHNTLKTKGITAGGPGSGCRGPNCGRPKSAVSQIPKADYHLSPKERAIETRFRRKIAADPKRMMMEYRANFGNVLNADNAKELSDDFKKDRTKSAAVHEPASWLIKQLWKEDLADKSKHTVFFTAGGAGAGKTTAINQVAPGTFSAKGDIIFDGTMRPAASAEKKVQQALDAGKAVAILYGGRVCRWYSTSCHEARIRRRR